MIIISANSRNNNQSYHGNISKRNPRGFTLIETMTVIAISTLLLAGVSTLFVSVFKTPTQQLLSADNVDQARKVLASFTNEMRNAMPGNDGSYQLNEAGDSQIIFYSNYGTSTSKVYRIRYYISGTTLYKGVVTPAGSPLTYNLGSEVVNPVQYHLSNGVTPVFYYYGDTYNGTTDSLAQPVNLTQVKFVKINLIVLRNNSASDTNTFNVSGGTTIRSLKTNLGN